MIKVYLIRHGETNWNCNRDLKYSKENHNVGLNEIGIKQVEKSLCFLQNKNIEYIYTSPLIRAVETATILSNNTIKMEIIEDLKEFSIYDDSVVGMTRAEIKAKIGEDKYIERRDNKDALLDWRPLNTETKREARNRIFNAIQNICINTPYNTILIVSHGNILKEFLRQLNYDDTKLKNCEIIEAIFDRTNKIIEITNRIKNEN